ncbi:hypothetical protein NDU88_007446 [Pleurodeles waltl]|uniref:Uncharacterized protein n=1 Tax=Pleurodeles waltl TaxID=8319 RepID=A0AAV7RRY3_PLEWA|nr:hypothetical protein NDU88_007446 [Pleurodeles waltl]
MKDLRGLGPAPSRRQQGPGLRAKQVRDERFKGLGSRCQQGPALPAKWSAMKDLRGLGPAPSRRQQGPGLPSKQEHPGRRQGGCQSGRLNRSSARAPKEYPETESGAIRALVELSRKLSGGVGETSGACKNNRDAQCDPTEELRPRSRASPVMHCAAAECGGATT